MTCEGCHLTQVTLRKTHNSLILNYLADWQCKRINMDINIRTLLFKFLNVIFKRWNYFENTNYYISNLKLIRIVYITKVRDLDSEIKTKVNAKLVFDQIFAKCSPFQYLRTRGKTIQNTRVMRGLKRGKTFCASGFTPKKSCSEKMWF